MDSKIEVIILNGPPGSGKDTIADYLEKERYVDKHIRFKDALFDITGAIYRTGAEFVKSFSYDQVEKMKPREEFNGLSQREALIFVSENVIKPSYGKDYFGKAVAKTIQLHAAFARIEDPNNLNGTLRYVTSDGGFKEEIEPLVGAGFKVILIRLHRDGCDFSKDSRKYLYNTAHVEVDVYNNGTIEETKKIIQGIMGV